LGPVTLSTSDTVFSEGRYWYEMEAVDQHGNRRRLQAASTVRVRIPDLAAPTVRWQSPENGMTISGGLVTENSFQMPAGARRYVRVREMQ
jgi:chitodextrinase